MLLCVYRDGIGRHSDLDTEPDSHTATSINRHIIRTAKSKIGSNNSTEGKGEVEPVTCASLGRAATFVSSFCDKDCSARLLRTHVWAGPET